MIAAIALWQSVGISWSSGGSESCSILVACVRVCVLLAGSVVVGASVFGLGSMFFAVFLSRVIRLSCLVSDFVMGGCSFVFVSDCGGWDIGHIFWASWWYVSIVSTTILAAISIWSVVICSAFVSC